MTTNLKSVLFVKMVYKTKENEQSKGKDGRKSTYPKKKSKSSGEGNLPDV